jgi:hypothetical protein
MNSQETARLAQTFAMYAAYYRLKLDDEVLRMYAEDLVDLPLAPVIDALRAYRANPKNRVMPMPADVRAMLEPQLDDDAMAREAASRVMAAISKFGYMRGTEAREWIGELGWLVVQRYGGWQRLCESLGSELDIGTFQAQARDLAKTQAQLARAGRLDQPPGLPGATALMLDATPTQGLTSAADLLKRIQSKRDE